MMMMMICWIGERKNGREGDTSAAAAAAIHTINLAAATAIGGRERQRERAAA